MKTCACGAEIRFGFTPTGTRIPLEPATHVYRMLGSELMPVTDLFRNHMITCPRAREFRNRGVTVGPPVDNSGLVHDLLAIALENPPSIETVRGWTPQQRDAAASWASRYQVADVPKPDFLEVVA